MLALLATKQSLDLSHGGVGAAAEARDEPAHVQDLSLRQIHDAAVEWRRLRLLGGNLAERGESHSGLLPQSGKFKVPLSPISLSLNHLPHLLNTQKFRDFQSAPWIRQLHSDQLRIAI
jgi:hypothetical protein